MVKEVVAGLVKRSFFDKGFFDSFGILTSRGIQLRYFEIVKRRKNIDIRGDILLVDVLKLENVNNSNEIADILEQKKRK